MRTIGSESNIVDVVGFGLGGEEREDPWWDVVD